MNTVFLLFGSNIAPRLTFLQKARQRVAETIGKIVQLSLVYESESWGFQTNQDFVNQVTIVETNLSAQEVLAEVLRIEDGLGRQRSGKGYSSRQIDIDILYFNTEIIDEPGLIVPHPGIPDRRFVLMPLVEIAEDFSHPVLKQNQATLLEHCTDDCKVWVYKAQKKLTT